MKTTTVDYPRGVTFEEVWAALKETDRMQKETDRMQKENARRQEETDLQMKETVRQMKELNQKMGYLHNSFGEIAEHLVAPGISKRFNELGFHFDSIAPGGEKILDENGKEKTQVDLVLRNGEYIVAIEVKTKPKVQDTEHHLKRLKILREYWNNKGDKRKLRGAIAGAVFPKEAKEAAINAGLYVLEQSGDTMKMDIPDGFVPGEW